MLKTVVIAAVFFAVGALSIQMISRPPAGASTGKDQPPAELTSPQEGTESAETGTAGVDALSLNLLMQALKQERQARIAMEQKVETLAEQVASLNKESGSSPAATAGDAASGTLPIEHGFGRSQTDNTEDNENLAAYGFTQQRIGQIRMLEDQQQMAELYLRDQASREDWLNTEKYRQKLQELRQQQPLRSMLSDDEYDRYLYASGRSNRVSVARVMAGSPAEKAGIEDGDKIVSYDDNTIFNWRDVRRATQTGQAGQPVRVEVERDGRILDFYIPRGPIGIQMRTDRVDPGSSP